ncbi:MAG: aldose 1-epimerase [Chitinophagaceae bacterium]|nr:aldose 1-epimerase [Chitinophagaceae bacterium]
MFSININTTKKHPIIELKDNSTNTLVEVFSFGAMLNKFICNVDGDFFNVIDGYENLDEAINPKEAWFKSCKLSPFVCRLHEGKFNFNNSSYTIEKFYLGEHAIHGIIYNGVYEIISSEANDDSALVELKYDYKGEDKGYPFPFSSTVVWKLTQHNNLSVTTTIEHHNEFAIPICDGWHPYFKMDVSVDACTFQINSNQQVEFDETLIPTGKIVVDERFLKPILLQNIELDNCFQLKNNVEPNCILKGKKLALEISSNQNYPYLQIYTAPHRQSIAIENLSATPDAFNNKMGLISLEPNTTIEFTANYKININ